MGILGGQNSQGASYDHYDIIVTKQNDITKVFFAIRISQARINPFDPQSDVVFSPTSHFVWGLYRFLSFQFPIIILRNIMNTDSMRYVYVCSLLQWTYYMYDNLCRGLLFGGERFSLVRVRKARKLMVVNGVIFWTLLQTRKLRTSITGTILII